VNGAHEEVGPWVPTAERVWVWAEVSDVTHLAASASGWPAQTRATVRRIWLQGDDGIPADAIKIDGVPTIGDRVWV
jgi:hypothetical protein